MTSDREFDAMVRFEADGTILLRFGGSAPRQWIATLRWVDALISVGWKLIANSPDYLSQASVTAGPEWILEPPPVEEPE